MSIPSWTERRIKIMTKQIQNRIEKTINKIRTLHSCNKGTKVTHIYKDTRNNDFVCFVSTRRMNSCSKKMATFNEVITMDNHYIWGVRIGYFCDPREKDNIMKN